MVNSNNGEPLESSLKVAHLIMELSRVCIDLGTKMDNSRKCVSISMERKKASVDDGTERGISNQK